MINFTNPAFLLAVLAVVVLGIFAVGAQLHSGDETRSIASELTESNKNSYDLPKYEVEDSLGHVSIEVGAPPPEYR
jgi:acid phosphatase family membrane protein YuiD